MAQSLSKILLHAVFSTKGRTRLIIPASKARLYAYLASTCRALGSQAFRIGGTHNHVHIACSLPRTIAVSKFLEGIKTASSKWMKKEFPTCSRFSWQVGYAVFSLGQSQLNRLLEYIDRQEEHHNKVTFKEEVLELLKRYKIEYDERYLWN